MTIDASDVKDLLRGIEIDMPRDPDNWEKLAYRSIRFNFSQNRWEYYQREMEAYGMKERAIYTAIDLHSLIRHTNNVHQIDDEVVVDRYEIAEIIKSHKEAL